MPPRSLAYGCAKAAGARPIANRVHSGQTGSSQSAVRRCTVDSAPLSSLARPPLSTVGSAAAPGPAASRPGSACAASTLPERRRRWTRRTAAAQQDSLEHEAPTTDSAGGMKGRNTNDDCEAPEAQQLMDDASYGAETEDGDETGSESDSGSSSSEDEEKGSDCMSTSQNHTAAKAERKAAEKEAQAQRKAAEQAAKAQRKAAKETAKSQRQSERQMRREAAKAEAEAAAAAMELIAQQHFVREVPGDGPEAECVAPLGDREQPASGRAYLGWLLGQLLR